METIVIVHINVKLKYSNENFECIFLYKLSAAKKFPNLWPGQLQYYSAMSYSQQCNELVHTKQHTSRIVRIV